MASLKRALGQSEAPKAIAESDAQPSAQSSTPASQPESRPATTEENR
jgi:hypothetical protein